MLFFPKQRRLAFNASPDFTAGNLTHANDTINPKAFTFCCFWRRTSSPAAWTLFSIDNGTDYVGLRLNTADSNIAVFTEKNSFQELSLNLNPTLNRWYFTCITITASQTVGRANLAGASLGAAFGLGQITALATGAGTISIGADTAGTANDFPGEIAAAKLWNYNMTRQEIRLESMQLAPVSQRALYCYLPLGCGGSGAQLDRIVFGRTWTTTGSLPSVTSRPSRVPNIRISKQTSFYTAPVQTPIQTPIFMSTTG